MSVILTRVDYNTSQINTFLTHMLKILKNTFFVPRECFLAFGHIEVGSKFY